MSTLTQLIGPRLYKMIISYVILIGNIECSRNNLESPKLIKHHLVEFKCSHKITKQFENPVK